MATFTLSEARRLIPEVRETTDHYHQEIDQLKSKINGTESERRRRELIQQLNYEFSNWLREMSGLGVQVPQPWCVEFDDGNGRLFCWHYDEAELTHYHRGDRDCEERKRLDESSLSAD